MSGCGCELEESTRCESQTLWILLAINGVMFVVEAVAGWWGQSTGLLADSLDMLADASVYGIALYAVGRSPALQAHAASASGYVQIALGIGVILEVVHRAFSGEAPASILMVSLGTLALVANISCLALLSKYREGKVHMRASWIFSVNDVLANLGLMLAGCLVFYLRSRVPDLIIGSAISLLVARGGVKILREAKTINKT